MSAINVYIKKYTVALSLDTTYSLAGDWAGGYGFGIGLEDPNNVWISGRAIDVDPNTLLSTSFGTGYSYTFFQNDGSIANKQIDATGNSIAYLNPSGHIKIDKSTDGSNLLTTSGIAYKGLTACAGYFWSIDNTNDKLVRYDPISLKKKTWNLSSVFSLPSTVTTYDFPQAVLTKIGNTVYGVVQLERFTAGPVSVKETYACKFNAYDPIDGSSDFDAVTLAYSNHSGTLVDLRTDNTNLFLLSNQSSNSSIYKIATALTVTTTDTDASKTYTGMSIGPAGILYINNKTNAQLLEYDTATMAITDTATVTSPSLNTTHFPSLSNYYHSYQKKGYFTYKFIVNAAPVITTVSIPNSCSDNPFSVQLTASGGTLPLTWTSDTGTDLPTGLTFSSSGLLSGTPTEIDTGFVLEAIVTDANGITDDATFTFDITESPTITTLEGDLDPFVQSTAYSFTLLATGGSTPYVWSVSSGDLPDGILLDSATGELSGTPTIQDEYTFTIRVTSDEGCFSEEIYTVEVTGNELEIATTTLPDVCRGDTYSEELEATGGNPPYIWNLRPGYGDLPASLSVNTITGFISGTVDWATAPGTYTFDIQVTDAQPITVYQTLSIEVNASPRITTASPLPDGEYDTAYSTFIEQTGGTGTIGWTISSGSLPTGLTLDSGTGEISGTPSAVGVFTFEVEVDSSSNVCTDVKEFTLEIKINIPASLPGCCKTTAYSETLTATGGNSPYTWEITGGALPNSLSLNTLTGEISGTVLSTTAAGDYDFVVLVTDDDGLEVEKEYTITVYSLPSITTFFLPAGALTVAYSEFIEVDSATSWAIGDGALPDGLALNTGTGEISGTPTVEDTFTFDIDVENANGCISTRTYTINIFAANPVLTPGVYSPTCNYQNYTATSLATGGVPPYVWTIENGVLPNGLTLNSALGSINGFVIEPGFFEFTIRVTDSLSNYAEEVRSILVYDSPRILTTSIPSGILNSPYNFTLSKSGGVVPYAWSIISGTLPAGLVLNGITGAITGTPTAEGYSEIRVTISDVNGCRDTKNYVFQIIGEPKINAAQLPPACEGQAYSEYIIVTGGSLPYYWFISSIDQPPSGFTLNIATGELSGSSSIPGTYPFTVEVIDGNNLSTTKEYNFVVRPIEECGQPGPPGTETITRPRLISTESSPIIVENPLHQTYLKDMLPTPFNPGES